MTMPELIFTSAYCLFPVELCISSAFCLLPVKLLNLKLC